MFGDETFNSLTLYGRIGLLTLSCVLFVFMILLTRLVVTGWPLVIRLMLALILLWAFIWLSPPVYHTYYSLFFTDMPDEPTFGGPPSLGLAIRVVTFTGPADMMHHAQGALGLLMVFSAIVAKRDPP